ncbi:MAG: thioredoxin-like domain-containing protein [Bacteroidetes bacterium]|nr:thioredoxin-like domain-containing protein [Bacteroidota bacterium]
MKLPFLSISLLIIPFLALSQQPFTITVDVKAFPGDKVTLASFYGEFIKPVDSIFIEKGVTITFNLPSSAPSGYYRIILAKDHNIDFIFNHENVRFSTTYDYLLDSLVVISSIENRLYYNFLSFMKKNQLKIDLLGTVVYYYPIDDTFYQQLCLQYQKNQGKRTSYIDSINQNYPSSYAARVIKTQNRPYLDCIMSENDRLEYIKTHFWENIDMTDTMLLRSNVFPNLCIEYLSLFGNSQFSQEQLEDAFIQAVNNILAASIKNDKIYSFMLEYLLKGFEKYHFEKVINHIATNYVSTEKCENESIDGELLRRLENYQKLAIGKSAPLISLNDDNNKPIDLLKINSQYILVLFWASWCPHCTTLLPKLKELYDKKTYNLEIVAISVDKDEKEYKTALEKGQYPWITGSELKGWNGKTAVDYNIYATPTMFLLDKNKIIIAKPITYQELLNVLEGQ